MYAVFHRDDKHYSNSTTCVLTLDSLDINVRPSENIAHKEKPPKLRGKALRHMYKGK